MAATFRFRASLLVSLILITTPSQCPSFASPSNPNLESKADSGGSDGTKFWCAAKNNAEDSTLQTALDWACGAGGADCRALQQGGPCYNPQDIQSMASYAFNDYALKNGLSNTTCNFGNSAAIVTLDPSKGSCVFPASSTVMNSTFTGSPGFMGLAPTGADLNGSGTVGGRTRALITVGLILASILLSVK